MRNDGIRQENAYAIYDETTCLFVFIIFSVRSCTQFTARRDGLGPELIIPVRNVAFSSTGAGKIAYHARGLSLAG